MQRWYGCGKALWMKWQGSSPGTAPQLWQLDWGCLDTEWTYLGLPHSLPPSLPLPTPSFRGDTSQGPLGPKK